RIKGDSTIKSVSIPEMELGSVHVNPFSDVKFILAMPKPEPGNASTVELSTIFSEIRLVLRVTSEEGYEPEQEIPGIPRIISFRIPPMTWMQSSIEIEEFPYSFPVVRD